MRSWLAVSKWVDDAAPFPGETFRTWVGDLYQRNALVGGRLELRGTTVDLSAIRCAVLNVSGRWDYVVPPCQTRATTRLAGGPDRQSVALNAGHVGMLVGPAAVGSLWPGLRAGWSALGADRIAVTGEPAPATRTNRVAPTSRWMAAARARESERGDGLLHDPLAAALAGPQGFAWLGDMKAAAWSDAPGLYPVIRARFFDEFLLRRVLDLRGATGRPGGGRPGRSRLPAGLAHRHPAVRTGPSRGAEQQGRRGRSGSRDTELRPAHGRGGSPRRDLAEALVARGYRPHDRSVWLIEGLLYYLARPDVNRLLDTVRRLTATESLLGLDVMNSGLFFSPAAWPMQVALACAVRLVGSGRTIRRR